jgi:hypothetical protein
MSEQVLELVEVATDEDEPTYGQLKDARIEELLKNYDYDGWSQRPNTFVTVTFHQEDGTDIVEHSWSKVSCSDVWDKQEGIDVAVRKAAARIAKRELLPIERVRRAYPPLNRAEKVSGNNMLG